MKERPILFSAAMVGALLDGSKTQTRRAVKGGVTDYDGALARDSVCPYGRPGDQLWVREAIRWAGEADGITASTYAADGALTVADAWPWKRVFLPSMHCPRGLSRIQLEVTGIRVERLQDISEADAIAEGIEQLESPHAGVALYRDYAAGHDSTVSPIHSYTTLWEKINGTSSWAANPLVWVVEFKRNTA